MKQPEILLLSLAVPAVLFVADCTDSPTAITGDFKFMSGKDGSLLFVEY